MEKNVVSIVTRKSTLQKRLNDAERRLAAEIAQNRELREQSALLSETLNQEKEEVHRRFEALKAILDSLTDPVLAYNLKGVIYLANHAACLIHGFDPVGMHRHKSNRALKFRYPDGRIPRMDELPGARALRGENVVSELISITNAAGETVIMQISASPLISNSRQVGVVSVWHDVTALKQAETALRESEQRFRVAIKNAQSIYAQTDRELRYVWIDKSHPAYASEDLIGKRDDELEDTPDTRLLVELKRQVLESGHSLRQELTFRRPSGDLIYDMTIEPLRDEEGDVIGVSTAALDITSLKKTQADLAAYAEKLERSNKDLEQFAFVASHDLQEPLRKILHFSDSALERMHSTLNKTAVEEITILLQRLQNAASRMQAMIDGLLELSRIATQGQAFEDVDLNLIAEEVISDLESRIILHQARIDLGHLPVIEADPMQMRQLLQNLISNALKFKRPDVPPIISISAEVKNATRSHLGYFILKVEDNGIGFNEEDRLWIFQPFRRLHRYEEFKGTGMGLAICDKIAQRHRGAISAHGRPGKGSVFMVQLPLRQHQEG